MKFVEIDAEDIIIRRKGRKYYLKGMEDLELSSRELSILLGTLQIGIEEIALMRLDFKENPDNNEAHFGINGLFLFTQRYYC